MHIIYQQWTEQSYPIMVAVFLISDDANKFLQACDDPKLKYVHVCNMDGWDAIRNRMHDKLNEERVDTDDESL